MDWQFKERISKSFREQFPEFNPLVLNLLWSRGIRTQPAIDEFFNPDYETDLHDPFLLSGMKEAVERTLLAAQQKEKIGIFGDYDVDGISGSVILTTIFKKLGLDFKVYIPDRSKEGYGLNIPAIEELARWGAKLIFVVDAGVTDFEEVETANKLGINVIIIDHHQPLDKLPEALVILNPHLANDFYPFKYLVAAGVAFKFAQALIPQLRQKDFAFQEGFEKWFLDLVVLATVADIAPMLGENRTLCKYGLVVLAQTPRLGLKELMNLARLKPSIREPSWQSELARNGTNDNNGRRVRKHSVTNLNSQTLSFTLINRINAASRMDHADVSFKLLMTESEKEAQELASRLEEKAKERLVLVKKIIKEFEANYKDLPAQPIIFTGSAGWSIGVLGLVANQLLEKHHKPVFIYEWREDIAMGSIRAEKPYNVVAILKDCQQHLTEYGGHPQSAGFRFKTEDKEKLRQCLVANSPQPAELKRYPLEIDEEITLADVNIELFNTLQAFEPFGLENPLPRFLLRNLKILERRAVGSDKQHSKLVLTHPGNRVRSINALAFNKTLPDNLRIGEHVDIVAEIMADEFRNSINLSLKIIDIKLSK